MDNIQLDNFLLFPSYVTIYKNSFYNLPFNPNKK